MSEKPLLPWILVIQDAYEPAALTPEEQQLQEGAKKAARGECAWTCPDCYVEFPQGMPDACVHGHQICTDILRRDKRTAQK
jgi:hypothetical protein